MISDCFPLAMTTRLPRHRHARLLTCLSFRSELFFTQLSLYSRTWAAVHQIRSYFSVNVTWRSACQHGAVVTKKLPGRNHPRISRHKLGPILLGHPTSSRLMKSMKSPIRWIWMDLLILLLAETCCSQREHSPSLAS